jgi:hypothetical protein
MTALAPNEVSNPARHTLGRHSADSGTARESIPWSPTANRLIVAPTAVIAAAAVAARRGAGRSGRIQARKNAPPMPMPKPASMRTRALQIAISALGLVCSSSLGRSPLGLPTENTTVPPTGWPSVETTRKLST